MRQAKGIVKREAGPVVLGLVSTGVDLGLTFWYRSQQMGLTIVNHGVAFGLGAGVPLMAEIGVAVALVVLGLLYWRWHRVRYPLAMMLGGAIANAISRILFGGVVDYWHVAPYPYVFNSADVAIRVGMVWLLVDLWKSRGKVGRITADDVSKRKEL